jgi:uncharacterized protein YjbI with pentapeptide repeats
VGKGATIDLQTADLSFADLGEAKLSGAKLRGANLGGADLSGARNWTNGQLAQAGYLFGATLPDGTVIRTEEAWEEFKKRYRP